MLAHQQQTGVTGCLYHAAHAILDDPTLLDHSSDVSDLRFYARLAQRGVLAVTIYAWDYTPDAPPAPIDVWDRMRDVWRQTASEGYVPLLVSIPGSTRGWLHATAVSLPLADGEPVLVSDSAFQEPLTFPWWVFLGSEYARCAHRIELLTTADLDAHPPDHRTP